MRRMPETANKGSKLREYFELIDMPLEKLLAESGKLRARHFGNSAHVCAIINARSGNCPNDCAFCAQSAHHASVGSVSGLLENELLRERITQLRNLMPGNIGIVCSGSALAGREFDRLLAFIAELDEDIRARLCLSAGTLDRQALLLLKEAGLRHYHHNLESSENFYGKVCSTQKWSARRKTAATALELGFEVCCGGLFGLGESWEDRISLALELKALGVHNVPLNFLIPIAGTPLASRQLLSAREVLRIIAVFRIIMPDAILRICGGRKQCLGNMQARIFEAGANALITGDYLTASGSAFAEDCALLAECGVNLAEKPS